MAKEIVIVTGSMSKGGAEGVIAQVSNGLAERGWTIHIIGLLIDQVDYELHQNVDFRSLAGNKRSTVSDSFRLIWNLRNEIKRINPDVVISFMAKMNILCYFALKGTRFRFIASERNDPSVGRGTIYRFSVRRAYAATDVTVFQTSRAKNYFPEYIRDKSVIIPNPVPELPEALEEKTKRLVAVGRLTKQKNHKLLIDAFAQINVDYPDFCADIYGAGEIEEEIREYIESKHVAGKIHLKGKVDNIPEHIRDAYMFVHTADYEGLSNALLEAMAVGLPCVTTNCAGSDDAIENGVNGLIVPVGDREEFVKAVCKVLDNPEYAKELGKNARASMKKYDAQTIIDQWEKIISN